VLQATTTARYQYQHMLRALKKIVLAWAAHADSDAGAFSFDLWLA